VSDNRVCVVLLVKSSDSGRMPVVQPVAKSTDC